MKKTISACNSGRNNEKKKNMEKEDWWDWRGSKDNGNKKIAHSGHRLEQIEDYTGSLGPQ